MLPGPTEDCNFSILYLIMKWTLTKKVNHSDHWQLEGIDHPIELRYNPQARSFRLNAGQKRIYFLERTGFFQSKLLITTEYNVKAGECYFIKNRFSGILQHDNYKYEFRVNRDHISLCEKNKEPFDRVDIDNLDNLDNFEFCALLFAFTILRHQIVYRQSSIVNGEW